MFPLQRIVLTLCALSIAAACARQEPAAVRESTVPPPATAPDVPLPESAESSLAIKRGTVTRSEARMVLRPCGETVELSIRDESSGALSELIEEADMGGSLYIEAYGERESLPAEAGDAFVLEQLLYAAPEGEIRGCDQPRSDYVVAARGNEPFWALRVTDSQAIWRQPEAPQEIVFEAPESQPAEGTVQYFASTAQHEVELLVGEQSCRDSMSSEFFAYTARAVLDGREFTGCARVGQ